LQSKGIKTFGPSQAAAQLEGSKTFSKDFFVRVWNTNSGNTQRLTDYDASIKLSR
jgi:phosphoribosylamine--glycine ligase